MMGWGTVSACVGAVAVATQVPVLWRYPRHPVAWVITLTGLLWSFDGALRVVRRVRHGAHARTCP